MDYKKNKFWEYQNRIIRMIVKIRFPWQENKEFACYFPRLKNPESYRNF